MTVVAAVAWHYGLHRRPPPLAGEGVSFTRDLMPPGSRWLFACGNLFDGTIVVSEKLTVHATMRLRSELRPNKNNGLKGTLPAWYDNCIPSFRDTTYKRTLHEFQAVAG